MCLINHTHRFVFLHVPKAAGSAVTVALSRLSTWRDLELGVTPLGQALAPHFRTRFGISKHAQLREVAALMGPELAGYRTIAVVRHPLSRLASTFAFLGRWTAWQELGPWVEHAAPFRATPDLDAFVRSPLFATHGPDRILLPQTDWLVRRPGGPIAIDRLLRMERLDTEFPALLDDLGLPPELAADIRLPRVNEAPQPVDLPVLSPRALEIVERRYARDLELLGYDPSRPGVP